MKSIKLKRCLFLLALMSIFWGEYLVFADPVREFKLYKGQSIFISADHLQKKVDLISENDEVASVLKGVITAKSEGETFIREVRPGADRDERFKIKVLPAKLVRYIFTEPNNPRSGEGLTLVAISDATVDRIKFLVSTDNDRFEALAEDKYIEGDVVVHKARIKSIGSGNFTVKAQAQCRSSWVDVHDCKFTGSFFEKTAIKPMGMRVSDRCVEYIKAKEGFRSSLKEDGLAKNVYDIGYGSGVRAGAAFYNNVSRAEAHAMLVNRLNNGSGSRAINNFILCNGLRLLQNEFDAISSFTYNLGPGWLSKSNLRNVFLQMKNTNSLNSQKTSFSQKAIGTVTSTNGLRLRERPSTQSRTLEILRFNEDVEILSESNSGWHRVKTRSGKEGFCSAEFLKIAGYTNSNIGVVTSDNGLRLREGPGLSDREISVMNFNEQVEVLSENNNGWYKVKTRGGHEGFCSAEFLTVEPVNAKNSASTEDFTEAFLSYNRAGGKFVKGLLNRRIEELQIFFYNDYSRDGGKNKHNFSLPDGV